MIPIVKSIEFVEDPALLVGLKSGAFIKLQPQVKFESFPANSTFLGAPRPPFLLLTDFEKEKVRIDTTIEEISGAPFSGNFADLQAAIGELVEEVNQGTGTGGNIFENYGDTGEYNQAHSAIKPVISTSTGLASGTQYAIPIFLKGKYKEFALIQLSNTVANFNFAIYEGSGSGDIAPTIKIYQSPEFTSPGAPMGRVLFQDIIAPSVKFKKGWYFFSYWASGSLTFTGTRVANTFLGWGLTGTPAITAITRIFKAGVYSPTLPAIFPGGYSNDLGNPSNPILFFKKDNS